MSSPASSRLVLVRLQHALFQLQFPKRRVQLLQLRLVKLRQLGNGLLVLLAQVHDGFVQLLLVREQILLQFFLNQALAISKLLLRMQLPSRGLRRFQLSHQHRLMKRL